MTMSMPAASGGVVEVVGDVCFVNNAPDLDHHRIVDVVVGKSRFESHHLPTMRELHPDHVKRGDVGRRARCRGARDRYGSSASGEE
jgi:hypothetical protein